METMEELKARLKRVIEQKDRYGTALALVLDAIRSGRYNGLFKAGYRYKEEDKAECSQGVSYGALEWSGCPKALECPTAVCPMTFHMRKLAKAYLKGMKVCEEQDAARIPFSPKEIPPYEPKKYCYKVSKRWFAKEMVRLIQAMRLGTENKDVGGNAALGEAYKRLVAFGMESIGMKQAWMEFCAIEEKARELDKQGQANREIGKWFEDNVAKFRHFKAVAKSTSRLFEKRANIQKMIRKAPSRAMRYLVLYSLLTMTEFRFTHDYPGADLGVYGDVFAFIGRCCLYSAKIDIDDRLAILEFVNSDDEVDDFRMMPIEGDGEA